MTNDQLAKLSFELGQKTAALSKRRKVLTDALDEADGWDYWMEDAEDELTEISIEMRAYLFVLSLLAN